MSARGHLVMIGGVTAKTPDRKLSLVSAVNGGQAALCKSIAEQGIVDGVHVNLIQPCMVQTRRRLNCLKSWRQKPGVRLRNT
jgi:NAD(P)-dependent dehydrogenase (short-subunit alcohol dehydrogenase family)